MEKEERNKGSVSWRVYWHYIKTFNAFLFLLCVFLFVLQNAVMVGNNYWLSLWSEAGINATEVREREREVEEEDSISGKLVEHYCKTLLQNNIEKSLKNIEKKTPETKLKK